MPGVTFRVGVVGTVPVVTAPEEVDISNAAGLVAALGEAAGTGNDWVVVDMTRTLFCDSSGISALAIEHRSAAQEGRRLLLAVSSAAVVRVLALTGVDELIPSFTTLEDALRHAAAVDADSGG
jgi:anti-sigma B factor antagonist